MTSAVIVDSGSVEALLHLRRHNASVLAIVLVLFLVQFEQPDATLATMPSLFENRARLIHHRISAIVYH